MTRRGPIVAVILCGVAVRALLAVLTEGVEFDLDSMALVRQGLIDGDPFDVYEQATSGDTRRWPYAPGLFPALLLAGAIASVTPMNEDVVIRLLLTAADAALALVVYVLLRARDGSERRALAGAALIALGPSLIAVVGFHGQLDTVTWLPAVAALLVWERGGGRRALLAGLLIGLAGSIKTVPLLFVFALLPTAAGRREAATLVVAAAALPAALLLPFFVADPEGVTSALGYGGISGLGGLSLLVQPGLAAEWLSGGTPNPTGVNALLQDVNVAMVILALLLTAAVVWTARTPPARAAVLLVLAVYVAGANFTVAYGAWAAILLVAAGMLAWSARLQLWLAVPTLLAYTHTQWRGGWPEGLIWAVYVPMMLALLAALAGAWVRLVAGELRRDAAAAECGQPYPAERSAQR